MGVIEKLAEYIKKLTGRKDLRFLAAFFTFFACHIARYKAYQEDKKLLTINQKSHSDLFKGQLIMIEYGTIYDITTPNRLPQFLILRDSQKQK